MTEQESLLSPETRAWLDAFADSAPPLTEEDVAILAPLFRSPPIPSSVNERPATVA